MRIESVRAVLAGYRKIDPDMERSFALVRIETDDGTVGWGESSTNWGHSYPTVFRAAVDDVCARHLEGRDPLAIRDRVADLRVALDGYLGWEGLSSQTIGAIEIALWDILGKTLNAPVHQLLGGSAYPIPLYGTGTTMFEESAQWHAHYFDQCMDLGFAGVKVRLGRTIDGDTEAVATVREHIGTGHLDGCRLVLVPRSRLGHRAVPPYRPLRHPLLRGAGAPVPDRGPGAAPAQLADPGGGGGAGLLAPHVRRAGPARRGPGLRARRVPDRRDPELPGDRRHRGPVLHRGHPPRGRADGGWDWPPTCTGPPRPGCGCASTTSTPTSR